MIGAPVDRRSGRPGGLGVGGRLAAVTVRVVVAEDSLLVREGIAKVLDAHDGVEVVALCADLPGLLEAVEATAPDVVLTDIRMPPTGTDEGIRAAATLRELHPGVGVVVLSQYAEPAYALELLDGGSEGRAYLLKERLADGEQLRRGHHDRGRRRIVRRPEGGGGAGRGPQPLGLEPAGTAHTA